MSERNEKSMFLVCVGVLVLVVLSACCGPPSINIEFGDSSLHNNDNKRADRGNERISSLTGTAGSDAFPSGARGVDGVATAFHNNNNSKHWVRKRVFCSPVERSRIPNGPPPPLVPVSSPLTHALKTSAPIKKRGPRFVFVAGLEGAGHEAFSVILRDCVENDYCHDSDTLAPFLWNNCDNPKNIIYTQGADIGNPLVAQKLFRDALRNIILHPGSAGTVFFLNTLTQHHAFRPHFMSYPNCFKQEIYPDVHIMARIMEEEELDFRVLVLHRPVHALIKHRNKASGGRKLTVQEQVLTRSSAVLFGQLSNIDPAFYHVVQYKDLHQQSYWRSTLSPFLFGQPGQDLHFRLYLSDELAREAARVALYHRGEGGGYWIGPASIQRAMWDICERLAPYTDLFLSLSTSPSSSPSLGRVQGGGA